MTDPAFDGDQAGSKAWNAIDPYLDTIDIHVEPLEFLEQFATCPTWIGHLFAVQWCDYEICNGGLHQFFDNSTGILAPEAASGYIAIGLGPLARIIEQAMAKFGTPYPRLREVRTTLLAKLEPDKTNWKGSVLFSELDDLYYDTSEELGLYDHMDDFAMRHIA